MGANLSLQKFSDSFFAKFTKVLSDFSEKLHSYDRGDKDDSFKKYTIIS